LTPLDEQEISKTNTAISGNDDHTGALRRH
jgi:hypothetical protein